MVFALVNSFELESGVTTFTAKDGHQLLEIFQIFLNKAASLKYTDYQLDFYLKGKQIDVLNIQFDFLGKPEQTEITSFKIDVGENLCSERNLFVWIDFSKLIIAQGIGCKVQFSFSGENGQAAKMIDQNVVMAFLDIAGKFFDAGQAKSGNFLSTILSYLSLT